MLLLAVVLGIGAGSMVGVSCVSGEPEVEIVEKPFGDEIYFVLGRVTHQQALLTGVTVYIDGSDQKTATGSAGAYQLYLTKKGSYTLRFVKEGFVDVVTSVSIDESTANRTSITVSVGMTKMSEPEEVHPDEEIEITDPTGRAVLSIVRSLAEKTNVSLTLIKDVPVVFKAGQLSEPKAYGTSYASVLIHPTGLELPAKSVLRINKLTSDAIRFGSMELYKQRADYLWEKMDNQVVYDASYNAYMVDIMSFSVYSLRLPFRAVAGKEIASSHMNGELTVDNCGNMAAVRDIDLDIQQRCGWEILTDIPTLITSSLPGITTRDAEELEVLLTDQLISLQGCDPDIYDIPVHLSKISVSGNSVLHYKNRAKVISVTCEFDIVFQNQPKQLSVDIKKYSGMQEDYSYESCYQHSGGSGK